jgi:putative tryptophan/tyrosine transport system substrate-binding protein
MRVENSISSLGLCAVLIALNVSVHAQQSKRVPVIGFLGSGTSSSMSSRVAAFRQGLRELGYVEGKNVIIEYRYAEAKPGRAPQLAAELVNLKVDVIVTSAGGPIQAAKDATKTVPIVFSGTADPVEQGFVSSLAKPGGNLTGLTLFVPELNGKRLELLKEAIPQVSRVAFFWQMGRVAKDRPFSEAEPTAKGLGLRLQPIGVKGVDDFERAFDVAKRERAQAVSTSPGPLINTHLERVVEFTLKNRLPAIYPSTTFVDAGGLMSYGPDIHDNWRRTATYVDKILKGTKPADLPVEQPKRFEFVINLKTAKQIGLTIPPNVLARADRVIR